MPLGLVAYSCAVHIGSGRQVITHRLAGDFVRSMLIRRLAVVALILLGVSAVAATGSSSKSSGSSAKSSGSHPPAADVTISKCFMTTNQFEGPAATLTILNHSSKSSNYLITVAFESSDGKTQLDTGSASVNNLAPGQTTSTDATSLKSELRSQSKFTCKVADVTRLSAVG
jgi:hypothetical protein